MKKVRELIHDVRNYLQVILWALQPEAEDEQREDGKKAVQAILDILKEVTKHASND